jgi:phytanoyl-CoA hydroxylase
MSLPADSWQQFEEQGYLRLGRLLDEAQLKALQKRIDDIMLGRALIDYSRLLMQLDTTTGRYEDVAPHSRGHKGATLAYRKIQDLEFDPLFLEYLQRPLFRDICARVYGPDTPIAAYRAMFMNKPARQGTYLPWHQDHWNNLDRDPLVTVWTALDPASKASGCMQIVPGSHKMGLVNPTHPWGMLETQQAQAAAAPERVVYLEAEPGEAVLMHNWLLHASDVNHTDTPRRAFSVCYMDARTQATPPERFSVVFGDGALRPDSVVPALPELR